MKEESVTVSDSINATDLDTVFSFYPVIQVHVQLVQFFWLHFNKLLIILITTLRPQEKDTILVESYARIKHLQTHTWLHLDKGTST